MRLIGLTVLVLSVGGGAAADDAARALLGKWKLDKAATIEAMAGYDKGTPEQQKEIKERASELIPDATIEFTATEVVVDASDAPREVHSYRVTGANDKRIDLEMVSREDGKVLKVEVQPVGRDVLHLTHEDAEFAMVLRRVKQPG